MYALLGSFYDGDQYIQNGYVSFGVDGTPGNNDMPGNIAFWTCADGAAVPTQRLILDSAGVLKPFANDGVALGTTALSYSDLFLASGGVINWAAGNVTATHASGQLSINGSSTPAVLLGSATAYVHATATPRIQVSDVSNAAAISALRWDNASTGGPALYLAKSRGSVGVQTIVAANDTLGSIRFDGSDGTEFRLGAQIAAFVDGTPGSGDMPGRLVFSTTADGASTVTERLILDNAGVLKPAANDGVALGTTALSYSDLFLASGGVVNWNAGAATITYNAGLTSFDMLANTTLGIVMGKYDSGSGGNNINYYMALHGANADGYGDGWTSRWSRGTLSSPTIVSENDAIILVKGNFYDGDQYVPAAQIVVGVDGTPGDNDMPGRMAFYTTADGASSLTERMRITKAGNVKIAGSAVRGTTEGTNHLDIFDGTAPVGTLTNGVSLYSASGELRSMDAAGNSTLLSPHDKETNEWIYHSVDTRTGKGLRIDMERMMRAINERFGWDFVHEFIDGE